MPDSNPQSFEHHTRLVPPYHFGISLIFVVNLIWSLYLMVKSFSWPTVLGALMALAFVGIFAYIRVFVMTVQDRVIRLEMRLRLKEILPTDLKPRIGELSVEQLIGLRFASDDEMASLVREVLEKKIADRKEVKRRVKNWQPDNLRA